MAGLLVFLLCPMAHLSGIVLPSAATRLRSGAQMPLAARRIGSNLPTGALQGSGLYFPKHLGGPRWDILSTFSPHRTSHTHSSNSFPRDFLELHLSYSNSQAWSGSRLWVLSGSVQASLTAHISYHCLLAGMPRHGTAAAHHENMATASAEQISVQCSWAPWLVWAESGSNDWPSDLGHDTALKVPSRGFSWYKPQNINHCFQRKKSCVQLVNKVSF